ncbi:MAG: A/G-specific adenine glycosylase [Burkholderiales bacterium]|nr:A/G-specific adenine glycosylase [Burkholderiales bacterium]
MKALSATRADRLIAWQRQHGRHALPWQNTRDPYRVWLSEIMLQQTQVATVLAYYERFLQRFPHVQALAAAPLDDVLALWSGLGYYSRARNLHRCAQVVVQAHGGQFPGRSADLAELPGIGRSTAAAIAAFCFDERAAILDGNVKRVLTRALGFGDDLAEPRHERRLWAEAEAMLPARDIAVYTQGLMDLGATVCSARRPTCEACPWRSDCVALAQGQPEAYPVKTRKLKRGRRENSLLLLSQSGHVWLVQRPGSGVWAGLWSLPEFADDAAVQAFAASGPGELVAWPALTHVLTHFDWYLRPWHWRLPARAGTALRERVATAWPDGRWWPRADATTLGLPAPVRRLLDQLP